MKALEFAVRTLTASAAMTLSQRIDMRVTDRPASDLPIHVVERLIHVSVPTRARPGVGQIAQASLAALALQLARATTRLPFFIALALNILSLVATNAIVASALGLSDMPWKWSGQDRAVDLTHKSVLAMAATLLSERPHGAGDDAPMT